VGATHLHGDVMLGLLPGTGTERDPAGDGPVEADGADS